MIFTLELGQVCISHTECRRIPHSPNTGMHYMKAHRWRKAWKEEVMTAMLGYPHLRRYFPLHRPQITVTFRAIKPFDEGDNLHFAIKPLIDALKVPRSTKSGEVIGAGVIEDDDPKHIPAPIVKQIKVKHRGEEGVTILIEQYKTIPSQ